MEEEGKVINMTGSEPNLQEPPKKPLSQNDIARMRKEAAMELANYKKRIRESVELKELQVRELQLNIEYYHVSKEYEKINELVQKEEAMRKAEAQKVIEESEKAHKLKPRPEPREKTIITP